MRSQTIRKYLAQPEAAPVYGPRERRPSKLDAFKSYIEERLKAGVWNARVLLRELRKRGYAGSYTILTDWLRPQRESARVVAVRRFETPIGHQAQVDWGHLGTIDIHGKPRQMWGFTFTLGYSRAMMAEAALDQTLGTLLRMHEEAFHQLGGVPEEILYDRMKTVWLRTDDRGEIVWHPVFLDFAYAIFVRIETMRFLLKRLKKRRNDALNRFGRFLAFLKHFLPKFLPTKFITESRSGTGSTRVGTGGPNRDVQLGKLGFDCK
jgi:transposase